jgi:hypothetical protein
MIITTLTLPFTVVLINPLSHLSRINQVKPKNDVEARVYEVLSHKNWGASTTLMNEIAQDTFDYERCKYILFFSPYISWGQSCLFFLSPHCNLL